MKLHPMCWRSQISTLHGKEIAKHEHLGSVGVQGKFCIHCLRRVSQLNFLSYSQMDHQLTFTQLPTYPFQRLNFFTA
jgi:hypothetical protein